MFDKFKEFFATKKVEKAIKNSPIHQVAIKAGVAAAVPIVGSNIPIGTGIAFTHKYNGDKRFFNN